MSKRIAIIGSNSFSGGDFVDLLLEDPDNEVIGLSRSPERDDLFLRYHRHRNPKFRFYQFDLNQDTQRIQQLFDEFAPEYIVNFAAQSEVEPSWISPWDWFQTNTVALSHLIHRLKDASYLKRYVHISSPEVYGSCQGRIQEDALFNPSTPYAASKAAADLLLFTYAKNFDFPLVIVRATNVYGVGQQLFKIVPKTIMAIKSGQTLELHGGGRAVKSYIHVRDVSRGEWSVMLNGRNGEVYHLSPERGVAVCEVVKIICERMKTDWGKVVREVDERLGQDNRYVIDSGKARRELNWQPQISFLSLALFRAFGPYFQVVLVEKAILWYRKPVFAIRETFPTTNSKICQTQVP